MVVILVIAGLVAPLILSAIAREAQKFEYPVTRKVDHMDDYHGTKVPDPYRWLEDDRAAETEKWVEAQNKVTFAYLEKIPNRRQMKDRLEEALQLSEVLRAVSQRRILLLFEEQRTAEPERHVSPEGYRWNAGSVS